MCAHHESPAAAGGIDAAAAESVVLTSELIQIDSTNTGDPATVVGEREAAEYVAAKLQEVGYETEMVESGAPNRCNVFARLPGADPGRDALLIHGHLDVVPADPTEWSVHPFSGAIQDGYVWGRGAVDMKDMLGMTLAIARYYKREGIVPPRDIIFAFLADEEAGGTYGAQWHSGWSTTAPTCSRAPRKPLVRSAGSPSRSTTTSAPT